MMTRGGGWRGPRAGASGGRPARPPGPAPAGHGLPFSTRSLAKLAGFPAAEQVADDISHQGPRALLREEGVTFQRLKTWKASKDPRYQANKAAPDTCTPSPAAR